MKKLIGKMEPSRVAMMDIPRPRRALIDGYLALTDLACTVSDAMDELGIAVAVPAAELAPMLPGARMAGPALTVRNIAIARRVGYPASPWIHRQCEIMGLKEEGT